MKKLITAHLAMLLLLCNTSFCQHKYNMYDKSSGTSKLKGGLLWGEFNVGYSTNGAMGIVALNYRKGNIYFGSSYYKSHACYHHYQHLDHFLEIDNSQQHKTVQSVDVFSGINLPGKWSPSITVGVSWLRFDYVNVIPVEKNVTIDRIWETIIGDDYKNEKLGSKRVYTIGIPVGINIHLGGKRFTGLNAQLNANLNTHSIFISGSVGIRLGRMISKRKIILTPKHF